jgi:hypothetical protein
MVYELKILYHYFVCYRSLYLKVETAEDEIEMDTTPIDILCLCRMCAQPCTVATSTNLLEPNASLTYQLLHNFGILVSKIIELLLCKTLK